MRPGTTFPVALHHNPTSSPSPFASPDGVDLHSAWHSPVPYLFGGLAAILGLIALALLTLACTYWRLTGYRNSVGAEEMNSPGGNGTGKGMDAGDVDTTPPFKEHVAVIMAGEAEPTYLATPAQMKDADYNFNNSRVSSSSNNDRNIVSDVEVDLERVIGVRQGDGNQTSIELNQQQLRQ